MERGILCCISNHLSYHQSDGEGGKCSADYSFLVDFYLPIFFESLSAFSSPNHILEFPINQTLVIQVSFPIVICCRSAAD